MSKFIFDHLDYKVFLKELCATRAKGLRKAMAQVANCQTAYISQVLNGHNHLSLEQAHAIAHFLGLSKDETRCFILLLEIQRAGTPSLRSFFEEQLKELRQHHYTIKERIGISKTLSEQNQSIYYSSWHYAAVHMAVTIPHLQTRGRLGKALRIPMRKLSEVLEWLCSVGLVAKDSEFYLPGTTELHLPKDSPLIHRHHANWRQQGMVQMHSDSAQDDLHYSSVSSLSLSDGQRIRGLITQAISDFVGIIKDSPSEQLVGINIDFFRLDE